MKKRKMCGVITFIRSSLRLRDVADKSQERRLRWYSHVAYQPTNDVEKRPCYVRFWSGTLYYSMKRKASEYVIT